MAEKFDESIPIYLQIVRRISKQIVSGQLKPGDKLKSVRDLALEMGVNPNTMQKALASLEADDLVYAERTSGRFVTQDAAAIERMKRQMLDKMIDEFVDSMKEFGYNRYDVIRLLEERSREEE